jgi:ferric-dicitrate binding protein FerR (iron transport regulator)
MLPDQEMNRLRSRWAVDSPAPDLADRIVRHALAQKQHRPLLARLKDNFALPQSRSFAMGGLAVAACAMVAIVALQSSKPSTGKSGTYQAPMDQIVEEMIWNDYTY